MHIILRYECEKALIDGSLAVADLPRVWNQKMKDYLGIEVESDAKGCLLFGIFQQYTLGTLMAEQLYKQLQQEFSDLDNMIKVPQFVLIKHGLNRSRFINMDVDIQLIY